MDDKIINNLKEALKHSPDNIPLRLHLAESLFRLNRIDEAEKEYEELLTISDNEQGKIGLANVFFEKGQFSKCIVVLEELVNSGSSDPELWFLYSKALLKENSISDAVDAYKRLLEIDSSYADDELDKTLKLSPDTQEDMDFEDVLSPFVHKPTVNFTDVGGMQHVKKEIEMKIIHPLNHPDLYKAYGKKVGGGILLYGPPGCGKTFIAKATAGQVNARFINVGLNDILDMWIGNSEKNLHNIFEIARDHAPCVLFFDEIDALGASRTDMKQSSGRHLINQFLQELDGLENNNEGVLILGATNTPWHLDPAFRRPGRFDRIIFVPPPDHEARESIFRLKLNGKPIGNIDYPALAKQTQDYSGADIEAVIDITIEQKLEESFKDGTIKPINTKDLQQGIKKHRASTLEWFSTAKNFALYANDAGLYDDILTFLKIKK